MKKYMLASIFILAAVSSVQAEDVIKNELALGCVEKEVAVTAAAEMAKYVELINKQDKVQFSEDCEVFMKGDSIVVVERPEAGDFIRAQRPAQIKSFWLPAGAINAEEQGSDKKE